MHGNGLKLPVMQRQHDLQRVDFGIGQFPLIASAKRGFRFMTVGSDFSLVRDSTAAALKQLPGKAAGAKDAF